MSTQTEERVKPETASGTDAVPEWAIGYAMILPCDNKTPPCCNEAEWFGNQHGCIKAHMCDYHMQLTYNAVRAKIAQFGAVQCRACKLDFTNFAAFIKAVRI